MATDRHHTQLVVNILLLCHLQQSASRDSARFLDDFGSGLSNATTELREDINAFFVGTVDTGIVPSILKGSIYLNEVYGLVNRTGLIVAGVALIGISGYYILNENQILPRADDLAENIKDLPDLLSSILSRYLNPFKSSKPSYKPSYKPSNKPSYTSKAKVFEGNYNFYRGTQATRRPLLGNRQRGKNVLDRHRRPYREFVLIDHYFNHPNRNRRKRLRQKRKRPRIRIPLFVTPFTFVNRRKPTKPRRYGNEKDDLPFDVFGVVRLFNIFTEDLHDRIVRRFDKLSSLF